MYDKTGRPDHGDNLSHHRRITLFAATLLFGVIVILVVQIARHTERRELDQLRKTGQLRLTLYGTALRDTLFKYRPLPYILARDHRIRQLLQGETPAKRVNPHLEDFAREAGALIFVMNSTGETVASSNWRSENSLIGANFGFRPYFAEASTGDTGGYYAFGFKTRKPGFFISYPVLDNGRLLGVIVVKVDLEALQNSWSESGETVLVSDAYGVVFLCSKTQWRYKSLRPLPEETATTLRQSQYLEQSLADLKVSRNLADGGNYLNQADATFFEQSLQLPEFGWRIHYLTDLAPLQQTVRFSATLTALTAIGCLAILLYLRERRTSRISRRKAQEAEAIRELNTMLTAEIEQHRQTETALRQTQKELVKTGRLAAMGQMSAAIVHELNQPVTAIRTFLASAKILVQRNQPEKVRENLNYIEQLTDRMATITGQLKVFASGSKGRRDPVDLTRVIARTIGFLEPQLRERNITLKTTLADENSAIVAGNGRKLEQVLNNLILNGMDAVKKRSDGRIEISLTTDSGQAVIVCADNGDGIGEEVIDYLFDPFFTTKPTGEGLGLGLAISYGIIEDMNGTIRAENRAGGGALFTVALPLLQSLNDNASR